MTKPDVVVVTGSSGFIGAALINKFAGDFSLVGFDRMASHAPPPAAECVCIDLTSELGVKGAFERIRIAYGDRIASVIHLAAYYDLSGEPSPLYEQITVHQPQPRRMDAPTPADRSCPPVRSVRS